MKASVRPLRDVFEHVRKLAVVFRDRDEAGDTGFGVKTTPFQHRESRERSERRVVAFLFGRRVPAVVVDVLLKPLGRLPEVVNQCEAANDLVQRFVVRCGRPIGHEIIDPARDIFEMIHEHHRRTTVLRRMGVALVRIECH